MRSSLQVLVSFIYERCCLLDPFTLLIFQEILFYLVVALLHFLPPEQVVLQIGLEVKVVVYEADRWLAILGIVQLVFFVARLLAMHADVFGLGDEAAANMIRILTLLPISGSIFLLHATIILICRVHLAILQYRSLLFSVDLSDLAAQHRS